MTDPPVNPEQLVLQTPVTATASTPVPAPVIPAPVKPEKRTFVQRLKRVAWRSTGAYLWVRFIVDNVFNGDPVHSAERVAAQHLTDYLSSVGFAPGNPAYLLPVFKYGWLLGIANFSFWEFIGFWIYVLLYPAALIGFFFLSDQIDQAQAQSATKQGLVKSQHRRIVLPFSAGLLAAWFLLYGSTTSSRQVLIGVVSSGLIFLSLALRAFQRARPLTEKDLVLANGLEQFGFAGVSETTRLKPTTKSAAMFGVKVEKAYRWMYFNLALLLRGKNGKNRVAMYVLAEYVAFLILLAFSAVLFWSLSIRLTGTPVVSLRDALMLGASHFLPGIVTSGTKPALPLWAQLGPALTAWILFVLFVGPAASLLPLRQEVYIKRLAGSYRIFRKFAIMFKARIQLLVRLRDKLD